MRSLALALLLVGGMARADAPTTSLSLVTGARANVGSLGSRYAFGGELGAEASVQPGPIGFLWTMGASYYRSSDARNIDTSYNSYEMDFGLRGRFRLGANARNAVPSFLLVESTLDLVRTSIPVPPTSGQTFFGPSIGGGGMIVVGGVVITLRAGYGLLLGGPSGLKLLVSIGYGTGGK